ncbi:LOW QUALITY PROTEIN: uncharacterized protein LOC108111304 [Drosophila eugracilis]|uniref:LOW QUALITY PROTEIN: uncharacterized protein LOC108111304 n=1 Tax=Drosophila eugracilis TaxID=29029 RepID=UPI001BD9E046|nr:LOW QUALITY PROTEIN: uncharacterized protein LOC108111304 [Drosophila eugracilis]
MGGGAAWQRCKFCGPSWFLGVLWGAAQFKLHNSDRSVKEISSAEGVAPLSYRAWESQT